MADKYIGGPEAQALIGAWQTIVGSGPPWHTIVGADTYYNPYQQRRYTYADRYRRWHPRYGDQGYGQRYQPYQPYQTYQPPYRPYVPPVPYVPPAPAYTRPAPVFPAPVGRNGDVRDHRYNRVGMPGWVGADLPPDAMPADDGMWAPPPDGSGGMPFDPSMMVPPPFDPTMPPPSDAMGPPPPVDPGSMDLGPPIDPGAPLMGPPPGESPHRRRHHHRHGGGGNGMWIPPRNVLVDQAGPSQATRILLPMSSSALILPNTSAQITGRPQNVAYRPERIIIQSADNWIVNDIKVGNRSQFSQGGEIPGITFGATTIDGFVEFETVQLAMDFVMVVTNVGTAEAGEQFVCSVLGTAAV